MQQDSSAKKFSYDLDNISYNLFKKMNLFVWNLSKFPGLFKILPMNLETY